MTVAIDDAKGFFVMAQFFQFILQFQCFEKGLFIKNADDFIAIFQDVIFAVFSK